MGVSEVERARAISSSWTNGSDLWWYVSFRYQRDGGAVKIPVRFEMTTVWETAGCRRKTRTWWTIFHPEVGKNTTQKLGEVLAVQTSYRGYWEKESGVGVARSVERAGVINSANLIALRSWFEPLAIFEMNQWELLGRSLKTFNVPVLLSYIP